MGEKGTRAEVSEQGMWQRVKRKKRETREVEEGGFYEVDAALVCDEVASFLVNLTRDFSLLLCLFPSRFIPIPLFFIIYRESMGMPISHIFS